MDMSKLVKWCALVLSILTFTLVIAERLGALDWYLDLEPMQKVVKRRAVAVFSMVGVALIAGGCVVSSAPEPASHTPEPASHTLKTGGLQRAKTDAPICETQDELVTAAYEYDGGHTPDVSGCTALAKGEEVKVLALKADDDLNAVQVNTQGHIGWTKSYYLGEPAVKSN